MKTVVVTYNGPADHELDGIINKALTDAGLKWYAQGYDLESKKRDICFDFYNKDNLKEDDMT